MEAGETKQRRTREAGRVSFGRGYHKTDRSGNSILRPSLNRVILD